jgi:hypothetical protein
MGLMSGDSGEFCCLSFPCPSAVPCRWMVNREAAVGAKGLGEFLARLISQPGAGPG